MPEVRGRFASLGRRASALVLSTVFVDGSPMNAVPERDIAVMKCGKCGAYTAVKDVLWGVYRCPCGWTSR